MFSKSLNLVLLKPFLYETDSSHHCSTVLLGPNEWHGAARWIQHVRASKAHFRLLRKVSITRLCIYTVPLGPEWLLQSRLVPFRCSTCSTQIYRHSKKKTSTKKVICKTEQFIWISYRHEALLGKNSEFLSTIIQMCYDNCKNKQ